MYTVKQTELAKIPYLDTQAVDQRVLLLMPFWDGGGWHGWFGTADGDLIAMKPIDTVRANYVAKSAAKDTDLYFPFLDFMWQRANFPETSRMILAISDDFHMLGTSAAKLRHFFETRDQIDKTLLPAFVQTELEYMLTVSRSVFDLLQEAVAGFWNTRVLLLDEAAQKARRPLPPTFSKVVLENNRLRTADQIAQRFGLPEPVAAQYAKDAVTFGHFKTWRDRIVHGGSSVDMIFVTERGFCVSPTHPAFGDFVWTDAHRYNEAMIALPPWVAIGVSRTIGICTELISVLSSVIQFPNEVAPGYRIFVRDPAGIELAKLVQVAEGDTVWWAPD